VPEKFMAQLRKMVYGAQDITMAQLRKMVYGAQGIIMNFINYTVNVIEV
jgi:hypothetical protein